MEDRLKIRRPQSFWSNIKSDGMIDIDSTSPGKSVVVHDLC